MRYFIIVVYLAYSFSFSAQGFNRSYFIPHSNGSYCKDVIEAPNGNIILTGIVGDTIANAYKIGILGVDASGNQLWFKSYGKSSFQYLDNVFHSRYLIQDSLNFYVYSAALDSNNKYFSVLIKFDYNGDTIWQKKFYDPVDHLYVQGITKSVDNGFLMTGFFEGTLRTCLLIKTDSNGNELWRKKIAKGGSPNTQAGHKIIQDSATGKIVIAGYQYNWDQTEPGNFSPYANVIVTNSLGAVLSKTIFAGNCGSYFYDLIQTKDNYCVVVGMMDQCYAVNGEVGSNRKYKGYAVKFDLNNLNNVIWQKQFDIMSSSNAIQTVTELDNGALILNGCFDGPVAGVSYYSVHSRIIKLDSSGNMQWKRYLFQDSVEQNSKSVVSLNKMVNGGFLLANQLSFYTLGPRPFNFTKIDSTGCDSTLEYCTYINSVGIDEFKAKGSRFSVYPNPVRDELCVNSVSNQTQTLWLTVINVNGQVVKQQTIRSEDKVNVSALNPGVYFLHVRTAGEIVYKTKIIKQE